MRGGEGGKGWGQVCPGSLPPGSGTCPEHVKDVRQQSGQNRNNLKNLINYFFVKKISLGRYVQQFYTFCPEEKNNFFFNLLLF